MSWWEFCFFIEKWLIGLFLLWSMVRKPASDDSLFKTIMELFMPPGPHPENLGRSLGTFLLFFGFFIEYIWLRAILVFKLDFEIDRLLLLLSPANFEDFEVYLLVDLFWNCMSGVSRLFLFLKGILGEGDILPNFFLISIEGVLVFPNVSTESWFLFLTVLKFT